MKPILRNWQYTLILVIAFVFCGRSQTPVSTCGFEPSRLWQFSNANQQRLEKEYRSDYRQAFRSNFQKSSEGIFAYKIPVVVHIIHADHELGSTQNPTNEQIEALIDQVNANFRHSYENAPVFENPFYGVDTQIELHFVKRDLQGFPTDGILRYNNPEMAFNYDFGELTSFIREEIIWDPQWICNIVIVSGTIYCGASEGSDQYTVYSAYCLSAELINHEIGHYFNLFHTFQFNQDCTNGDCLVDNDKVCDTPPSYSQAGCSVTNTCDTDEDDTSDLNPYRAPGLGGMGDQEDMNINYMSYAAYECQESYTAGQKIRMHSYIQGELTNLVEQPELFVSNPAILNIRARRKYEIDEMENTVQSTELILAGNFPDAYLDSEPVILCFETHGNHYGPQQVFSVIVENELNLGNTAFSEPGANCYVSTRYCLNIPFSQFETWMEDGIVEFELSPLSFIPAVDCGSYFQNTISVTATFHLYPCSGQDLNIEGILDQSYYISSGNIISTGNVSSGYSPIFRAQNTILLNPGFQIYQAGNFTALIGPCSKD